MAHNVLSTLELDKEPLDGKIILINENSGNEANFFFSCFMSKQIKEGGGICLVNVQNDFNHFYNTGLKMGYNLKKLKDVGSIRDINVLQIISDRLIFNSEDEKYMDLTNDDSTNCLYNIIENTIKTLQKTHKSICIIIDDITNFLNFNFSINDVNKFVQKCKNLTTNKDCSLVIGLHTISSNDISHTMSKLLYYISDIVCEVSPLSTGRSLDVSGSFRIIHPWNDGDLLSLDKSTSMNYYLFKLFDRGVKVFAPGSR